MIRLRWAKMGVVAAIAMLSATGCSGPASSPTVAPSPKVPASPIDVVLSFTVDDGGDGTVTIHATTNLPDGTELLASVVQKKKSGVYRAGDTKSVSSGGVDLGPFSDGGGALREGRYGVVVTMPIAVNQPDQVKAVIGEHGENLRGPLVSQTYGNAVVMTKETTFTVTYK